MRKKLPKTPLNTAKKGFHGCGKQINPTRAEKKTSTHRQYPSSLGLGKEALIQRKLGEPTEGREAGQKTAEAKRKSNSTCPRPRNKGPALKTEVVRRERWGEKARGG